MKPTIYLKGRSGIYGIINTINNKIYVGRTKCMYRRCHQYVYDFENRSIGHINDYLFNSMKKHGIENFLFTPLEFAAINQLEFLELKWMKQLNSCDSNFGYNLRKDSLGGMTVHPNTSSKISENLKKQWRSGIRDGHSGKLKAGWADDIERKKRQSSFFTKCRTKYEYFVIGHGISKLCSYAELKSLGLAGNALSAFHRKKTNSVITSGFEITRYPVGEYEN